MLNLAGYPVHTELFRILFLGIPQHILDQGNKMKMRNSKISQTATSQQNSRVSRTIANNFFGGGG